MWKEFKEFAIKGNMLDLAVGVIVGGAFGKIVTSLVSDIITPLVGLLLGNVDLSNLFLVLGPGDYPTLKLAEDAKVPILKYGLFLNNVIDFLIISFSIFIVIKQLSRFKRKEVEEVAITTKTCNYCYSEIHIDATRCPHCTSEL